MMFELNDRGSAHDIPASLLSGGELGEDTFIGHVEAYQVALAVVRQLNPEEVDNLPWAWRSCLAGKSFTDEEQLDRYRGHCRHRAVAEVVFPSGQVQPVRRPFGHRQ